MIIKALKTFSDGIISMHEGEIAKVPDAKAQLYISEGYAVEYSAPVDEADLRSYAKLEDIAPISAYVTQAVANGGNIYKTVPTDTQLLEMDNNTYFYAQGYYNELDGNGGYYKLTETLTANARKIEGDSRTVYLVALNQEGGAKNVVNLCRYGIRDYQGDRTNLTSENSYANLNSNIIDNMTHGDYNGAWYLPQGRYYFARTISLVSSGANLIGDGQPLTSTVQFTNSAIKGGTILVFPFLSNGDYAIVSGNGNIENIAIVGDPAYYSITFDRDKIKTDVSQVVNEIILQENGEDFKCYGLHKTGTGFLRNICICNFYQGAKVDVTSFYGMNLYATDCRYGYEFSADSKVIGVYGWRVRALLYFSTSVGQASFTQLRADDCVNVVYSVGTLADVSITDVDGDFCTKSLIEVGNGTDWASVTRCRLIDLKGRYCTLKAYDDTVENAEPKASDLTTSNSDGYGAIHVKHGAVFNNNYIVVSLANRSVLDGQANAKYKAPSIAFTFETDSSNSKNNHFVLTDTDVEDNDTYIKGVFQCATNNKYRIDTALNTYYVNGNTVDHFITKSEAQALINS